MLRLAARQQRRGGSGKDMSFLRRLFIQGRLLIYRNYPSIFGGVRSGGAGKCPAGERNILLRIDGKPPKATVTGNVGVGNASRGFPGAGGSNSGASTLQRIGTEIHSQVRKIFINNVLRRATANQEVARKAAQRLRYGDSRPFFALVGVSLATGSAGIVTKDSEFDGICWEIRVSNLFKIKYLTLHFFPQRVNYSKFFFWFLKESIAKKSKTTTTEDPTERNIASVDDLTFGPILNKGCSAAVYAAKWNDVSVDEKDVDWPLAVKMLFNYDIESNAFAILKAMVKEIVPARRIDLKNLCELEHRLVLHY